MKISVRRVSLSADPPTVTGRSGVQWVGNVHTQTIFSFATIHTGRALVTVLTVIPDEYLPTTFEFAWVGHETLLCSSFEAAEECLSLIHI